jgi:hypothetical protein
VKAVPGCSTEVDRRLDYALNPLPNSMPSERKLAVDNFS